MKTYLRALCLSCIALLLCLPLTGCDSLDEARTTHGIWDENGNILLNEETYLLLPECDYLQPQFSDYTGVYVTESDVPVLLKGAMGEFLFHSDDKIFLSPQYSSTYYCRADHYEKVTQQIRNGFTPTGYCYSYSVFDEETFEYSTSVYHLTDAQVHALSAVLATVEPVYQPAVVTLDFDYMAEIMACGDDLYFRQYACDVLCINGYYYVAQYTQTDTLLYEVPLEHHTAFHALMETQRTIYEEELSYWDEEESL
jgi:hypothetical protein